MGWEGSFKRRETRPARWRAAARDWRFESLAASDPDNAHYRSQLGFSHHNVGLSLIQAGQLSHALEHFRLALTLFDSLSAADPKDAQARRNRSLAHKQIGEVWMRKADSTGAGRVS